MSSLSMSDEEIRMRYKNGVSVGILADLNATTPERIKRIVSGANLPEAKERYGHVDPETAFALYKEGKNDREIADELGVVPGAICYWRNQNLLDPIPKKGTGQIDEGKARELYEAGKHDPEIAEVFGVSPQSIFNWRKQRGLPAKRGDGRPRAKRVVAIVNQEFEEAVKPMFDQAKADYQAKQKEDQEVSNASEPAKDEKELFFADVTPESANAPDKIADDTVIPTPPKAAMPPIDVKKLLSSIKEIKEIRISPPDTVYLEPRRVWEERRFEMVCNALAIRVTEQRMIPIEWVEEYNERALKAKEDAVV